MVRRREEVGRERRLSALARVAVAALALASCTAPAAYADFSGRVVIVHDGDTLSVLDGARLRRVRLVGIDAPERGQPYAAVARRALAERVDGRTVRVVERGHDVYGRVLGRVFADALDVNAEQVRDGHAWVFRRYVEDRSLLALEAEARAARRGLWHDARPMPPWEWRERTPSLPSGAVR